MRLAHGVWALVLGLSLASTQIVLAAESRGPEEVLRALVQANAEMDLSTLSKLMAHDEDIVGYTIGGRKYVGWTTFAKDMEEEFASVTRLELPITQLKVWTRGETAWFAMELDYVRYVRSGEQLSRTVLPLRETGVLERRNGNWLLVAWHESSQSAGTVAPVADRSPTQTGQASRTASQAPETTDLSGQWEIQEEDKSYVASLDRAGNGSYTWQGGRIGTTGFTDRMWQGTWQQPGNDREGGFEVLLSEDGQQAKGVWWYTRVGDRTNIPPRQWGGSYTWKRLRAAATPAAAP